MAGAQGTVVVLPSGDHLDAWLITHGDGSQTKAQSTVLLDAVGQRVHPVGGPLPATPAIAGGAAAAAVPATPGLVLGAAGRYTGFTCRELLDAQAAFRLRDGNNGALLETVSLAPNESRSEHYPVGRPVYSSIVLEVVAGAFELQVFAAAL